MLSKYLSLLGAIVPLAIHAQSICPLIGPDFPAPKYLSTSKSFQAALTNLTQVFGQTLSTSNSIYGSFDSVNTSFSLGVFSTHESALLYTEDFSAPALAASQYGVKKVDSSTVFRIGSVTKLFSVYTFLIKEGDVSFNDPITKYVPELLEAAETMKASRDSLDFVAWEDVTVGELASQTAGIGRDYAAFGELESPLSVATIDLSATGLPPLNSSELPTCLGASFCTRAQFFAGFTKRHPVYAPSTAPTYSNVAYQIFAYALENITGVAFQTLAQDSLFKPLDLTESSWTPPASNASGIIPAGFESSWSLDIGDESPAGGMYSSINDLTKIGRSILTSSLLKPVLTRRWLKPRAFISNNNNAVGAPWEIFRLQTSPNNRIVDLYTKGGDLLGYATLFALIPDWDLGFVILTAGPNYVNNNAILASLLGDTLFPAIEAAAREEANASFSGTYTSSDKSLNSSIIIATDPSLPGLGITSWISNGTNMLTSPSSVVGPSVRLYPSGLERVLGNGDIETGFRAVYENPETPAVGGMFGDPCQTWFNVDATYWGTVGTDEFVLTVGGDGVAKSVSPRFLRVSLDKVQS